MQTANIHNVCRHGLESWSVETVAHELVKLGLIVQLPPEE